MWLSVGAIVLISALNVAAIQYFRTQHPNSWSPLRRQLLGPLDGFPLVREQYYWCLGAAFAIDTAVLGRRSALALLLRFGRSERVDLAYGVMRTIGLGGLLPALLTLGLTSSFPRFVATWRIDVAQAVPEIPEFSNAVLQIVFYTVIVDFLRYWWHRWMHHSQTLWAFHEVHHSATSFTLFTGNRQHPVEDILAIPVVVLPLLLLGATGTQVVWVIVFRTVLDLLQHSMVPFSYGWFGRWIFYSPIGHRVHHSPMPGHWDRNYGDLFPVWDHMFATWYDGEQTNATVGALGQQPRSFVGSLVDPFRIVGASLRVSLVRRRPAPPDLPACPGCDEARQPSKDRTRGHSQQAS